MHPANRALEKAAHEAASSNVDSVQALAHSVLNYPHVYSLAPQVSELLEARLSRSEIAYRNGLGSGVKEEQLLSLINDLAKKLKLPTYAQTTPAQLRNLRMRLAINSPYFMGAGLTSHAVQKGQQIKTTLSPIQAMHLLYVMIDQKILNDIYQDPSIDIVRTEEQRHQEHKRAALAQRGGAVIIARSNPRIPEIRSAISRGMDSMSLSDAIELVNEAFTKMGLK